VLAAAASTSGGLWMAGCVRGGTEVEPDDSDVDGGMDFVRS
jgi:hypothetical protein